MGDTNSVTALVLTVAIITGLTIASAGMVSAAPGNGPSETPGNGNGPPADPGNGNDPSTAPGNSQSAGAGNGDDTPAASGWSGGPPDVPGGEETSSEPTFYNESAGMTLYAGQDIPVGTVTVEQNGSDQLDITYTTTDGWEIAETHLEVSANDTSDMSLTKSGNPQVGQFAYSDTHDPPVTSVTYTVDVPEPNDGNVTIAAHAVVRHPEMGEQTAWADGTRFVDPGNWATYFTYGLGGIEACPVSSGAGEGFVEILGTDSSNYPTINSTVRVNTTEGTAGNLTEEHFIVCEEDRLQDESVSFVQSGTTGIDMVFVLDVSGSMGGEITTLQEQMRGYINAFAENNTNARFALITYGGFTDSGDGVVQQELTDNVTDMQEAINATSAGGGFENATDAYRAAQNLSTRNGATKVVVDITDEDDDGYYPNMNATNATLDEFDTEGWVYVAISPAAYPDYLSNPDTADDQRTYAERLDGQWTDIEAIRNGSTTLDVVLQDLQTQLVTTYQVSYTTNDPSTDGTTRTVLIYVDDPSGQAADTESYTAPP